MIIIEGADLAGKTTLCKEIQRRFGSNIVHLGRPSAGRRHWDDAVHAFRIASNNTVFDRAVVGSQVYAFKKDKYNAEPVTNEELARFINFCKQGGHLLVHATEPLDLAERYAVRGDSYLSLDDIHQAHMRYHELIPIIEQDMFVLKYPSFLYSAEQYVEKMHGVFAAALNPARVQLALQELIP